VIKSTNPKSKKKSPKPPGMKRSANPNLGSESISTGLGEKRKNKKHYPALLIEPLAEDIQAKIAERAHELFEQRGRVHGDDWQDWLKAEQEFLGQNHRF
jgi:Protein of unknown function (DUF2934)